MENGLGVVVCLMPNSDQPRADPQTHPPKKRVSFTPGHLFNAYLLLLRQACGIPAVNRAGQFKTVSCGLHKSGVSR